MSKSTSPVWNHFYSKVFTKQKLHGGPNSLAGSLTFGAPTNRGTIQAIPRPSCAASTAFSSSTTVDAGGSCQFIGSTRTRSTRFHKVIFSQNCSDLRRRAGFEPVKGRDCLYSRSRIVTSVSIAGAKRTNSLLLQICPPFPAQVVPHTAAGCTCPQFAVCD